MTAVLLIWLIFKFSHREQLFGGAFNFNFGGKDGGGGAVRSLRSEPTEAKETVYKPPDVRAMGRPHELGWLEKLDKPEEDWVRLGEVPAGRIIAED